MRSWRNIRIKNHPFRLSGSRSNRARDPDDLKDGRATRTRFSGRNPPPVVNFSNVSGGGGTRVPQEGMESVYSSSIMAELDAADPSEPEASTHEVILRLSLSEKVGKKRSGIPLGCPGFL